MTLTTPQPLVEHGDAHAAHGGHNMTGFIIFLCSESVIF